MRTIYWNDMDGYVTDDPQYALMYSTVGDLYTETYKLRNTDTFISISYTQFEKENANLYLLREAVVKQHGFKLYDLEKGFEECDYYWQRAKFCPMCGQALKWE